MSEEIKERCTICIALALMALGMFAYSVFIPDLNREIVRIWVGWLTFGVSVVGAVGCFHFARVVGGSRTVIAHRFQDVCFATGLIAIATAAMGLGGAVTFTTEQWDIVYNLRLFPLVYEFYAIMRLVNTMLHL